jgi:hypothetical protein
LKSDLHKSQHSPYKNGCQVRLVSDTGCIFETACLFDGELGSRKTGRTDVRSNKTTWARGPVLQRRNVKS